MGLLSLLEILTNDERIDNAVQESCKANIGEWDRHWTGASILGKRCGLAYYVPSKFSIEMAWDENYPNKVRNEAELETQPRRRPSKDSYVQIAGEHEEEWLLKLMQQGGDRLCVWQGPGAGKTIFTRRLLAFLSTLLAQRELFGGRPALVIRREEAKLDGAWPNENEFLEELVEELGKANPKKKQLELKTIVKSLLREGRVALVLDALDQSAPKRVQSFRRLLSLIHKRDWRCRIIVTSRPYAVPRIASEEVNWKLARLEAFDRMQQYQYLRGPQAPNLAAPDAFSRRTIDPSVEVVPVVGPAKSKERMKARLAALIPDLSDEDPLTGNPQNLFHIRELSRGANGRQRKIRFRNRADLYLQVTRQMWLREVKHREGRPSGRHLNATNWPEYERILSSIAFAMMTNRPQKEGVQGAVQVAKLKRLAEKAYGKRIKQVAWDIALKSAEFTNRSLLAAGSDIILAWPNRRMMEFHCGLHLASNCQAGWVKRSKTLSSVYCGDSLVGKWAACDEWREAWIHAIELGAVSTMPGRSELAAPKGLLASLSVLFELPSPSLKLRRPTELMHRAWELFQIPKFKLEGDRIIKSFQAQFESILRVGDLTHATIAAQLLPAPILDELILERERLQALLSSNNGEPAFVICPPEKESRVFWMGTHSSRTDIDEEEEGEVADEQPRHPVRVAPFWMQTTSVTEEQYLFFDPTFATPRRYQGTYVYHAPSNDCPMVMITYFDATMFALWTGNCLPTEMQREFAARAGRDGPDDLFGISCNGKFDQITSQVANFDGRFSYPNRDIDSKRTNADTAIPGRWTQERRATFNWRESRKPPCFEPNAWGLWQLQGNVSEWCRSIYEVDAYLRRALALLQIPEATSLAEIEDRLSKLDLQNINLAEEPYVFDHIALRSMRGGGCHDAGISCRAASRMHSRPNDYGPHMGFRLCREFQLPIAID